jgi:hypothetical protein
MRALRYLGLGLLVIIGAADFGANLHAFQRWMMQDEPADPVFPGAPNHEFTFGRLIYRTEGRRYGWPFGWDTDYPKADRQFMMGVKRMSLVQGGDGPVTIPIMDPRLFDYPWIYAVEVGFMVFDDQEAERLREYLLRGGFFVADDFHGAFEWAHFEQEMRKVFPDRPIVEIELDDPIFHCFFDITEKIQLPVVSYVRSGITYEKGGITPHHRGIYDDKGRLMVMINFNMDTGDAWEWADLPEYPEKFSGQAYRLGLNYIVYAMTH